MNAEGQAWIVKVFDDLREEDLVLVADFFNENFPGVFYPRCSPEIWKWKLGASNPAGRGFLTVAFIDGKVVGTTSGTRQRIHLGTNSVSAMEIGDTFTHPDFRKNGYCKEEYSGLAGNDHYLNRSVFGRLVTETLDRAAKEKIEYVFGTPNLNSRPPYLSKLGFTEIGDEKVRSWTLLTSSRTLSPKYRYACSFLDVAIKSLARIARITTRQNFLVKEISFEGISSATDDFRLKGDSGVKSENSFYF